MACPYFYPEEVDDTGPKPARVPLGVLWRGRCELGGTTVNDRCNFGYAAGACEAFPSDAQADAVRFTQLDGKVLYILEKNHFPAQFGEARSLTGALGRQAEVFGSWARK